MHPEIFGLKSYGLVIDVGAICSFLLFLLIAARNKAEIRPLSIWYGGTFLSFYGGAHLFDSGLSLWFGLIGAIPVGLLLGRLLKLRILELADFMAAPLGIGIGFGKVACFLAGCCFGIETEGVLGVQFPFFSPAHLSQIRDGRISLFEHAKLVYPVQLFEAAGAALLGILCIWLVKRKQRESGRETHDGVIFALFMMIYAGYRLLLNPFRYQYPNSMPLWNFAIIYGVVILLSGGFLVAVRFFMTTKRKI